MVEDSGQSAPSLAAQDEEFLVFLGSIAGRVLYFIGIGVLETVSLRSFLLYYGAGFLPKWRWLIMIAFYGGILFNMPGTKRIFKITALAYRGYTPWDKAVFEIIWGGSAVLI